MARRKKGKRSRSNRGRKKSRPKNKRGKKKKPKGSRRPKPKKPSNIFNLIKLVLALFTIFVLLVSIYLTFTSFFIGLFIPPIACIAIAGLIIRFFNRRANGKKFFYDALALAGIFLLLLALILYQALAPIFGMFG